MCQVAFKTVYKAKHWGWFYKPGNEIWGRGVGYKVDINIHHSVCWSRNKVVGNTVPCLMDTVSLQNVHQKCRHQQFQKCVTGQCIITWTMV